MKRMEKLLIICFAVILFTACSNDNDPVETGQENIPAIQNVDIANQEEEPEIISDSDYTNESPAGNELDIIIEYVDNHLYEFLNGFIIEEVEFYALGEHGEYFFVPGDWTEELMSQLIAVSEDGIKFAKEWLGYESDKPLKFVFGNVRHESPANPDSFMQQIWGGGCSLKGETFINTSDDFMPSIIVHEAVHAVLIKQPPELPDAEAVPVAFQHRDDFAAREGLYHVQVVQYVFGVYN